MKSWKIMEQPYLRVCYSVQEKFNAIERYLYHNEDRTLCVLTNLKLTPVKDIPFEHVVKYASDETLIFVELIEKEEINDD